MLPFMPGLSNLFSAGFKDSVLHPRAAGFALWWVPLDLHSLLLWRVLGALFLAIGFWAWGEKGVLSNISALTDLGGLDPVWLFVVVGGVMSVLGFAGCIGALRENTFLLKFDWIRDQLNLFINSNVKAYRDDIDLQNLIDFAQEYWSCCGARGPNDWNLNIYFNCTDLNPSRERCGVPFSCCVRDPAEDVLNTQCGYDIRLKLELEQQGSIYTKGCVGQFEKWLQDNLIVVAGVLVGIALLQIFGICLAQNLVSDIKAVKANWISHGGGYKLLNKRHFEKQWLILTIFEGSVGSAASELSREGPGLHPTA
ncbi:tetraspanin-17 isoform X3 [Peromyscus leucopus]|uniref:tetraspanin-17 isoform X3 n=1 Tax=Peromyscus leucopus TaxID=10041 RepID=UPI001885607A|nr:tetraspanin-17 isoform X3 [Peromyscus leucopus]